MGGQWVPITFVRYYSGHTVPDLFVPNLQIEFNDNCEATITWDVPIMVENIVGYNVYRNDELIAEGIEETSYTDTDFESPMMHEWCVMYITQEGYLSQAACVSDSCTPKYTIAATATEGGSISPNGEITVIHGSDASFSFASDYGYALSQVLINGVNVPEAVETGSYTFENVMSDQAIEAVFQLSEYTIVVSAGNGGAISPSGNVGVNHGDTRTFTITPDGGYDIAQVLVDGVNKPAAVSQGTYTFADIAEDHTIEALFVIRTYTITAMAEENGSISPDGETNVNHGDSQVYTITPNTGYKIAKVLVDGINNEAAVASGSYEFADVTEDHNIKAQFEKQTYTIIASAGEGGTITPAGETTVLYGGSVFYSMKADDGYKITKVLVDGNEVYNGSVMGMSYELVNVSSNHTIHVEFALDTAIDNVDGNTFAVYPNPTTGPITVEGLIKNTCISLFDIAGNKVFETTETEFDIAHLKNGIYMLKAGDKTVKVIKR